MQPEKNNGFTLSHKTRTGALILLVLTFILLLIWRVLPSIATPAPDTEEKELQQAWIKFKEKNQLIPDNNAPSSDAGAGNTIVGTGRLFPFDPNTVTEKELKILGLSDKTIRTLINYRNKGGRFYKKEDLKKLYTLKQEDYRRIAPYVRVGIAEQKNSKQVGLQPLIPVVSDVELNSADAENLMRLKGIGTVYARRIISFRNALGGFVSVEQLKEVYGLPDSTYQQLQDKVRVDTGRIKKISINAASANELVKHPYIDRRLADNIIRLRNDIKRFDELEQLRHVPLINEEKYRKIAPYLSTH